MKKSRFILLLGIITTTCLLPVGKADWSALKKSNTLVASSSTAVCYIGSTKFTTLDDALYYAEANNEIDKIYVIPGLNTDNEGLKINNDHKINKGDSLVLPIDGTTVLNEEGTNAGEFADKNEAANLKTRITLKAGKTLTINGTLEIGAVTGSKSGIMGQASGSYCELLMRDNSSLVVNGALNCYGFIKESAQNKSAISVNDGGKIETPVVFYDHVDGTTSAVISGNGVFPYKQFDIPQIRSKMVFNYGSNLIGRMHIYGTTINHCTATANLIGTSSSFINMESNKDSTTGEEKTKLIWRYSDISDSTTSAGFANHATNIEVYGTQSFGSISATIYVKIDSKDYYLPIPCGYNIVIGDNTENSATFTLPSTIKGVKFMPGSSLTCNSGAIVNFNSGALFYQSTESNDGKSSFAYPSSDSAICLNNGIMNINSCFEGRITTSSSKTKVVKLVFGQSYTSTASAATLSKELTNTSAYYSWGGAFGQIKDSSDSILKDDAYFDKSTYSSSSNEDYWNGVVKIEEVKKDITDFEVTAYCQDKATTIFAPTTIDNNSPCYENPSTESSYTWRLEINILPIGYSTYINTDVEYQWELKNNGTRYAKKEEEYVEEEAKKTRRGYIVFEDGTDLAKNVTPTSGSGYKQISYNLKSDYSTACSVAYVTIDEWTSSYFAVKINMKYKNLLNKSKSMSKTIYFYPKQVS